MLKPITLKFLLFGTTLLFLVIAKPASSVAQTNTYPKVTGYFSIVNPIGTISSGSFHSNFSDVYTIGFPFGINILKSDKFGISFEMAPFIRTENNQAKVNSVLFHPGAMFRFKHGFNFIGRLAFETNGRFGLTPVFNKVLVRGKDASMFLSVPFPVRLGNNQPTSIGTAVQMGVTF